MSARKKQRRTFKQKQNGKPKTEEYEKDTGNNGVDGDPDGGERTGCHFKIF